MRSLADTAHDAELSSLAHLLSRAQSTLHAMPLEAKVCSEFGLQAMPDFPIAPIAAKADGLALEGHLWFRADPVHFVLQRDAFSLHDEVPIALDEAHAKTLIADLNQHFSQEGLYFACGNAGHWYVHCSETSDFHPVTTALPQLAAGKNVQHYFPQGKTAKKWRSVLNEVQMLLHEHPVNLAREKVHQLAVNSLWFSGGGKLPSVPEMMEKPTLMLADHPLYAGLANLVAIDFLALPNSVAFLSQHHNQNLRMFLTGDQVVNTKAAWISTVLALLKTRKIHTLTLNVGFFDQTLTANISPFDLLKFWRKAKPLVVFFEETARR